MVLFAKEGAPPPSLVNTEMLKESTVNPLSEFIGTVNFEKQSTLASESDGLVKQIRFEVGKSVKKGEVLLKIDSALLDANIASQTAKVEIAKREFDNAKKDFERYSALLANKSISQKTYDDALLKYESAKQNVLVESATLDNYMIQKNKKSIKAPYDGIIVEKNVNLSEWLTAGKAVAVMVNTNELEMLFNLPLNYVNGLKKDTTYDVLIGNSLMKAKLYAAIPKGDTLTRTFPVRFKTLNKNAFIFDGAQAKVKLSQNGKVDALMVSRDAVIKRFGNDVIFTINDKSQAVMIPVKIIGFEGLNVAIQGQGLKAGMPIVVKGNERIFPNSPVKVLNK
jgi:RND family efflux transporter MFP subunit